jgi:hypothetical protein
MSEQLNYTHDVVKRDEMGNEVIDGVVSQEFRPSGDRYGVRVDQLLMLTLSRLW